MQISKIKLKENNRKYYNEGNSSFPDPDTETGSAYFVKQQEGVLNATVAEIGADLEKNTVDLTAESLSLQIGRAHV